MPLTLPPFAQYQAPMVPLRGLWNNPPPEGDYFVNAEIDWTVSPPGNAVQFQLAGNSPVTLSQIAALVVDNGRCGADVSFVFPDSGFELVVAAHNQGVFPVFTNALMFYAVGANAVSGDVTVLQILNSIPPPIPIVASSYQANVQLTANDISQATIGANHNIQILPASAFGTLRGFDISVHAASGGAGLALQDGTGKVLWGTFVNAPTGGGTLEYTQSNLSLRYAQGLVLNINNNTLGAGSTAIANVYYSTP